MFVKYQHEPDKLLTFVIIPDWIESVAWAIKVREGRMPAFYRLISSHYIMSNGIN